MALQQVDIAGRQMNRLVDLRSKRRGLSASAGTAVQFFILTAVDEDGLEGTHQIINSEGNWVNGPLGENVEIAFFPETGEDDYEVGDYIAAVKLSAGWVALAPGKGLGALPNGSVFGDMVYYDGEEWLKLPAPGGVSEKYVLVAETDEEGDVIDLSWNLVAEFECPEDD